MSPVLSSYPPLIAVMGSDDGLVQEAALRWFGKLTEGTDSFSHEILDGNVSLVDEAVQVINGSLVALQTLPFFGNSKTVWLKNCSFIQDNPLSRSEDTQRALDGLLDYLKGGLTDGVHFLLTASHFDKRRTFYRSLAKMGMLEEYNKPDISRDGWQAEVSITTRKAAEERGLEFERDALDFFVNRVSESSRQIFNELDKLDLYLGPDRRRITVRDVMEMVPLTRSGVIFEIGRSLESGDAAQTLFLIDRQLDKGEQPVAVMRAAIIPVIRNLYMASVMSNEFALPVHNYRAFTSALKDLPEHKLALVPKKKDGEPNAYPLFLAIQKLGSFSREWLRSSLTACLEADKALVSSSLDNTVILHKLVVTLCQRKAFPVSSAR